jgi:omega-amidase
MKIYCVQCDIAWENKPANHAKVKSLLAAASPQPGALALLPEMFSTGFSMNIPAIQEGEAKETERFLAATAREFGIFLLGGVVGAAPGGRGRNQALIFSPEGKEIARYTKLQPFSLGGESQHFEAGTETILFPWEGFKVSPFICYDLRFPEHFRKATRAGAQLITVIASWPVTRIGHWIALLQARAIENQAYVAGVNRCGAGPDLNYNGRSLIIAPSGEILADAGESEKVISADLNLETLLAYRKNLPFLADMR